MSGLLRANKHHAKWLIALTIIILIILAFDFYIRPKKERYNELWEWKSKQEVIQAEHETRIKILENQK